MGVGKFSRVVFPLDKWEFELNPPLAKRKTASTTVIRIMTTKIPVNPFWLFFIWVKLRSR